MNPLQQGLKPQISSIQVSLTQSCNNESTTTRIETMFGIVGIVSIVCCNNESTTTRIETPLRVCHN